MSALTDVERVAFALALVIIFALGVLFLKRLTDAERRLTDTDAERRLTDAENRIANAERRLTDAERQSLPDTKKEPIGFWRFSPA